MSPTLVWGAVAAFALVGAVIALAAALVQHRTDGLQGGGQGAA